MFNFVNGNPFNRKIESALSTGQENKQQNQQQQQDDEKSYLGEDDNDEVSVARPELSEDDISFLVKEYISKKKTEYSENEKILQKLDKYLSKFDVKKFMKNNPHINAADFNIIMYNEISEILK